MMAITHLFMYNSFSSVSTIHGNRKTLKYNCKSHLVKKKHSRFQVTSYSREQFVHLNLWRRVCSFTALPFFIEFGGIPSARNSDKATVYNKVPRAACEA